MVYYERNYQKTEELKLVFPSDASSERVKQKKLGKRDQEPMRLQGANCHKVVPTSRSATSNNINILNTTKQALFFFYYQCNLSLQLLITSS